MIKLKTQQEILIMQEGGQRLKTVVQKLLPKIEPGITTQDINRLAERLIIAQGGDSSFNKVTNYNWSTCLPINEQIVHTPPSDRVVKGGDVLTLDIGFYWQGFHTDFATTFIVGDKKDKETEAFLQLGRETLAAAIREVKDGQYLGRVSKTIQEHIEGNGLFVVDELTGHGIGRALHEDPYVPGVLNIKITDTYKMRPGLVIAVEVIYAKGTRRMVFEKGSKWSIKTADGSLSACFEHTVAITDKNTIVLT